MAVDGTLMQRFERARASTWLLAALATWAVLLWLGALLGMGSHLRATPVLAADPLPQPTVVEPARIGPLAQYAEAASRPLFTQDRRPRNFMATGPDGTEEAAPAPTLDFILTGVLISPQVQLAILQPTSGGESQRVRVGNSPEGVAGWQLSSLEPRRAIFQGGSGQVTLDLRTYGDASKGEARGPPEATATATAPTTTTTTATAPRVMDANAVVAAAADTAGPPPSDQARIEAIRKRIEARRAQQRAAGQTGGSSEPPKP